jgi:hypothetical protein
VSGNRDVKIQPPEMIGKTFTLLNFTVNQGDFANFQIRILDDSGHVISIAMGAESAKGDHLRPQRVVFVVEADQGGRALAAGSGVLFAFFLEAAAKGVLSHETDDEQGVTLVVNLVA